MGTKKCRAKRVLIVAPEGVKVKIDMKVNKRVKAGWVHVDVKGGRHLAVSLESDGDLLTLGCAELPPRRLSARKTGAATVIGDGVANTGVNTGAITIGRERPKRSRPQTSFTEAPYDFSVVERRPYKCTITIHVPVGAHFALQT